MIVPSNSGGNTYDVVMNGGTLTQNIASGVEIEQLFLNGGTLVLANPLVLNTALQYTGGTISGGILTINGAGSTQSALLTLNNATIENFGSYNLNVASGNLFGGSGGTFNNLGNVLKLGAGTVNFNIPLVGGAGVLEGTLRFTAGGTLEGAFSVDSGALLELAANYTVNAGTQIDGPGIFRLNNGTTTTIGGTLNNRGLVSLNSTGSSTDLVLSGNTALVGGGTLSLSNAGRVRGSGVLTITDQIVAGETSNTGSLGNNEIGIVNQTGGLINANVNGLFLLVDPNAANGLSNLGIMQASNGGLLRLSGGGGGGFNNSGGVIQALNGSEVQILGGTSLMGGTLNTVGTGVIRTLGNSATFANLTNAGVFRISNGTDATFLGTINNTGNIIVNGTGNFTDFIVNGNLTLQGGGMVTLMGAGQIRGGGTLFIGGPSGETQTIQGETSTSTASLGTDTIGIVNRSGGMIDANVSGLVLNVDPSSGGGLTNAGLMRASNGGILQLNGNGGGVFANSGTISAITGGTLRFNGVVNSSGIVDVGGNTLTATGNYTQTGAASEFRLAGGSVQSNNALVFNSGLIDARGTINAAIQSNAMLRPALGGSGLMVTGNVSLLSSSNLVFNLGGLTQGSQYGFMNVNGNVSLGGNLVVSFVNGFLASQGDSFTVLSSTGPLSGMFANIASGGRLTTSDSSGSFLVTYGGNNIVLSDFMAFGAPITVTWDGSSGNWSAAANWNPMQVPNNGNGGNLYNAVLNAGTLNQDIAPGDHHSAVHHERWHLDLEQSAHPQCRAAIQRRDDQRRHSHGRRPERAIGHDGRQRPHHHQQRNLQPEPGRERHLQRWRDVQ